MLMCVSRDEFMEDRDLKRRVRGSDGRLCGYRLRVTGCVGW